MIDYGARVRIQVIEGALVEVPTADATGMDRRAFGGFVGAHGELASYAIGWTTGADPHVGRISIGIGAGNPGGATIHAVIFEHEGSHAFSLVDEPFERVPEGGPDLSADEARAHEDLPFMWWVADRVMERDRRAYWLRHWLLGTNSIQTAEVFERTEPILYVSHDADDGIWQLIGASDANPKTGKLGHLSHAIDEDPTLIDILDLTPGERVERDGPGRPWKPGR
ncbi:hypothetical protein ACQPZJ_22285 [Actinoplanes sp. CA-054009]